MLRLDIKNYVDAKFENLNQFSKAAGLNYQAAQKIYNGETSRITFDNLESICKTLDVTPNDIFIFDDSTNNSSKKQTHILHKLEAIHIDPEKLKSESKYSDEALYKLISQIVDDAVDSAIDKKIKNTIKVSKAKDDDN